MIWSGFGGFTGLVLVNSVVHNSLCFDVVWFGWLPNVRCVSFMMLCLLLLCGCLFNILVCFLLSVVFFGLFVVVFWFGCWLLDCLSGWCVYDVNSVVHGSITSVWVCGVGVRASFWLLRAG